MCRAATYCRHSAAVPFYACLFCRASLHTGGGAQLAVAPLTQANIDRLIEEFEVLSTQPYNSEVKQRNLQTFSESGRRWQIFQLCAVRQDSVGYVRVSRQV